MNRHLTGCARAAIVFFLAIAATPQTWAAEHKLPNPKDRWIEVRTANFTIFSNASEKTTIRAGANLEELRSVLQTLFGGMSFLAPVPTYIFVFSDPKDFSPYTLYFQGKATALGGYFSPGRYANHVAIVANRYSRDVSTTIYHEYIHYVLNINTPGLPLWLDEGLAEFYSSFDIEDGVAKIGYPIGEHLAWLHAHTLIPFEEMTAVDHDSATYHEGNRRGSFYAQSWAFTHMLIVGGTGGHVKIRDYTSLLRRGTDRDAAFQTAFGGTYKQLERELNRYVKSRKFGFAKLPASQSTSRGTTTTEMDYPEVATRLGELLASLGPDRYGAASAHFNAALRNDPGFAPAISGLGYLDELGDRPDQALQRYREAAALPSADFMVHFRLGNLLYEKAVRADAGGAREALIAEARTALRHVTVHRSSFGEAWALLGRTYFETGDPEGAGINALEMAHRLLPKRGDIGYNLAALCVNAGRLDEARAVVARMKASGVEVSTISAAAAVVRAAEQPPAAGSTTPDETILKPNTARTSGFAERYNAAVELVNAGELEGAAAALEDLLADELTDHEIESTTALLDQVRSFTVFSSRAEEAMRLANSGEIDAAIDILEPLLEQAPDQAQTAEIRRMLDKLYGYRDFQSTYNRAVDLFNAGRFGEAAALLEPLVDRAPSPQLARMASTLLDEIRRVR